MRKILIFILLNYSISVIGQNKLSVNFNLCKLNENEFVLDEYFLDFTNHNKLNL